MKKFRFYTFWFIVGANIKKFRFYNFWCIVGANISKFIRLYVLYTVVKE